MASDEHPLEILLESASEGRMAKLILRDNLTGSIDVSSHYTGSLYNPLRYLFTLVVYTHGGHQINLRHVQPMCGERLWGHV